ncbi:ATP-dependent nuclease [Flavobacterium beibuense]|uniref:Putative ATP-dependent endonuclease of the OLD family n=1 Tax=Flavobacterium beibuense TaxID=657326 RepID=A0A444WEG0_9FLAO|nr:AAA family ATPase [Flavobacterium beibuense]RYJ44241.1 putative ATP-dependent endonuclease of the OLD family [Flavobacterium beibuense]
MYLKRLLIKRFRSIYELETHFNKGVNIIIGENNAGKSAVIDTLRICLSLGRQWRDIGIRNPEDFYVERSAVSDVTEPIEFQLEFAIESADDSSFFHSLLWQDPDDASKIALRLSFRYEIDDSLGNSKMKWNITGGHNNPVNMMEMQQIYYSYLEPLRNAVQELRPYSNSNKVTSLFKDLTEYEKQSDGTPTKIRLTKEKKAELAGAIETVLQNDDWTGLIGTGQNFINTHLENADIKRRESKIHLKLLEYKYDSIVRGLLTRKQVYATDILGADVHLQKFFDVEQNGLGENNIILAATVLGDLSSRRAQKIEHYYALLIEEPEAHLHPQRQNTFFNYLNSLQSLGIQIFITSHSPTITAKSDLDNLLIIQKCDQYKTSVFTPRSSALSPKNKSYLEKFLDVTKSQLFFANGVILVEGISEALLLPVMARRMGEEYDLDKNGIEIVNINGVAFEAFANLFNDDEPTKRLASYCSLITDDDQSIVKEGDLRSETESIDKNTATAIFAQLKIAGHIDPTNRIVDFDSSKSYSVTGFETHEAHIKTVLAAKAGAISARAAKALGLKKHHLHVELAKNTFEYELAATAEANKATIAAVYNDMHSANYVDPSAATDPFCRDLLKKLKSNKDKSELAESLAYLLETDPAVNAAFIVPTYLQNAIRWVVNKSL